MQIVTLALGLAIAVTLAPVDARAWRDDGHRIVCHIALLELEPGPRAEVARLIALDTSTQTFEEACIWPDDVKFAMHRRPQPLHYVSVPEGGTVARDAFCPPEQTCLLDAIGTSVSTLSDPGSDDIARLEAIKYLGHLVGDLHQPMHIGYVIGQGGNNIHVIWQGAATPVSPFLLNPRETNMHRVWDHEMIDDLRLQPYRYATRLWMALKDGERAAWAGMDIIPWAQESRDIATAPATRYLPLDPEGPAPEPLILGPEYLQQHWPVVEDRLKRGGVRLGYMLNLLLAK